MILQFSHTSCHGSLNNSVTSITNIDMIKKIQARLASALFLACVAFGRTVSMLWDASNGAHMASRSSSSAKETGQKPRKSEALRLLSRLASEVTDPSNPTCATCLTSVGSPICNSICTSSISSLNARTMIKTRVKSLNFNLHFLE